MMRELNSVTDEPLGLMWRFIKRGANDYYFFSAEFLPAWNDKRDEEKREGGAGGGAKDEAKARKAVP